MINRYVLLPREERLRKHWLVVTGVRSFIGPILLLLSGESVVLLLVSLIAILAFGLMYYLAYKKHGNKWLTFCLVVTAVTYLRAVPKKLGASQDLWTVATLSVDLGLLIWWYYLSIRLRALNRKIRSQPFLETDAFKSAEALIRSATSLEELRNKYHEAFRKVPKSFVHTLSQPFEEMKASLQAIAQET